VITKLDTQFLALKAITTIKNVLEGNLSGTFKEESLDEIRIMLQYFDTNAFLKESDSYSFRELGLITMACNEWLDKLNIDVEYVSLPKSEKVEMEKNEDQLLADKILAAAHKYKDIGFTYKLGAKYDPKNKESFEYIDKNGNGKLNKNVLSSLQIDCSGLTRLVYRDVGINIPSGAERQMNALKISEKAVVGGLMYLAPSKKDKAHHIAIVVEVNKNGEAKCIIESANYNSVNNENGGYREIDIPRLYLKRDHTYVNFTKRNIY